MKEHEFQQNGNFISSKVTLSDQITKGIIRKKELFYQEINIPQRS